MVVATKYLRQQKSARRTIARKGTTCSWWKQPNTDTSDDQGSEFPVRDDPVEYPNVPIVFYPERNLRFVTQVNIPTIGELSNALYALIPGDVDFEPIVGDYITCGEEQFTVATVNTTKPDLVPIIHELSFK